MKKFLIILIASFSFAVTFAQVKDYTGNSNPFTSYSQDQINIKMINIVRNNYPDANDLNRAKSMLKLLLDAGADPDYQKDESSYPPLYQAVRYNNFEFVKILSEAGADVNFTESGETPVLTQMILNDFTNEQIEYLLIKGALPYSPNKEKINEPIVSACYKKNLELVKLLVKYGADIKTLSHIEGKTTLETAVEYGDLDIVKYLIENGFKPKDLPKNTPPLVYYSLRNYDIKMSDYLLENGDDINKTFEKEDGYKITLLQSFFLTSPYYKKDNTDNPDIVKYALEHGADPFIKDSNNKNAFDIADECILKAKPYSFASYFIRSFYNNVYDFIPANKHKKTAVEAYITGDTEALKTYLKKTKASSVTASIYNLGYRYNIPNSSECTELLLNAGVKPDYYTLLEALNYSKKEFSQQLVKQMDLVNGDSKYKYSFLSYYEKNLYSETRNKIPEVIDFAFNHGFTMDTLINSAQQQEKLPVFFFFTVSKSSYSKDVLTELIKRGADVNQQWNGKRPIDYIKPSHENHDFLMSHGAKVYN